MLFNRQGLQQKNWRMVKKGKHILFGCSLFFIVGGVSVNGPQVTYAKEIGESEVVAKQDKAAHIVNKKSIIENPTSQGEKQVESSRDKVEDTAVLTENEEKTLEKKEVNKKSLKELVDKIKNTDISKKTEESVKELNLVLSRAEKAIDNKEITQEEIDKEVKLLKEVFDKLEDKPRDDNKSEVKEKVESKKDEKVNSEKDIKEKQQDNNTEDVARRYNEKITKATNIVKEINSLASEINYEFSDSEKELVNNIEKLPTTDNNSEESIQKLLNEAIYLRNRVANRVTRANSGRRDPRNGKVIDKNGKSGFRAIEIRPLLIKENGVNINSTSTNLVAYNSDDFLAVMQLTAPKGTGLVNRVTVTSNVLTDLQIQVSTNRRGVVTNPKTVRDINIPSVQAAIVGKIGGKGLVKPGTYQFGLTVNDTQRPNINYQITYNIIIKPQSERNEVRNLSTTYVDDVRHLTETEKTALIEKFKAEHPDVVNRKDGLNNSQIDFDHAEVSADGTTMTIHFKDGFATKTIQTNATNDVEAKHSNLTAYFGDSKELYTNPRALVRSKTGNEVPTTAQVTYKTPFNLQQAGTRNVVVTTTYENGVTKDVTTPYTVLDFIGKQDKKINQNQSGQLGDARNYITVSDNSALPGEFTVRWKGGSSTVDTSAAGVQYKEIEILRGNHLMKTVTIPVEIVDNINPTITAPDSVLLTRLEGLPSEINISAQDNNKGVGLKDSNPITVENLPNPLFYNPRTSKIEINGVIPNNFQNGRSSIQVTVKAVDRKGNTATKNITFNIQSQTQKYTAVANPKIQEVSYAQTPDPGTSINTTGLPANTQYKWERKPDTNTPGNKEGIVKVTYPDGSIDTVTVTVKVRKLSDEHEPTAAKIVKNQNGTVSNDDLKAAVTINNNGNSKVRSVTPVGNISTTNAGTQTINATVIYLDGTTDPVSIPLEVKDVTAPTIQTPSDRQNWDLIALDRTLPEIKVTSEDNAGGTGIKSTTVTGLPDFLVYDNATKTIKFKNGTQEVTKLPVGQDSKTYNVNIQVMDNSNNSSQRSVTITVKSMTTKYSATANSQIQTVSYGETPDAGASINKTGLPTGTTYTWRTTPNTTTGPGQKAGVVIATYPDGSIDLVNVTVNVRKLSEEHEPIATKIVKNQNDAVSNGDLKAAVTINNNGNSKVKSVTPVGNISTTNTGTQTINATVTYLDGTTDPVSIPLEVKDVTAPTIQTPTEGQLWEITSLDKTLPEIKVMSEDNAGGSGVKSIVPINLPSFLKYDKATNSIVFQDGVSEVPKLSGINRTTKTVTLRVEDNAGNSSERTFQIRQISMAEKYNPQGNTTIQEVSHEETPDPKTSLNTVGLPDGVQYTWKSTPDTSKPGDKTGVVTVTYPDDSIDEVTVTVKVRKLSDEYDVTGTQIEVNQNDLVSNDDLKAKVTATSKVGNEDGTDKISKVEPKAQVSTAAYGETNIEATVTFKDGTTKDVTIPLKVKDVTPPTITAPTENTNWEMTALDKTLPSMEVRVEDNANGSGVKTVSVEGLPDYLEYDSATNSIKFKAGKQEVEKLPENTPSKEFTLNIRAEDNAGNISEKTAKITISSMSAKTNPQPNDQTVNYGQVPNPEDTVNKQGLPDGTTVTWKTPPVVNTPGSTTGEVEITYLDGSKDVVTVNVTVRKVSEEFTATGTQIEVNQNEKVTSDMLKGAVNATNEQGENGNAKISKVESKSPVNTTTYGDQTIQAKVTYIDGSEQDVTIPLKVKDVTNPTIQTPAENTNWEMTALDKTLPVMKIEAEDNANGSGIATIEVNNMPSFLTFDKSTGRIVFKEGVQEVPKIESDSIMYGVTIIARDKAGNSTSKLVNITVSSMRGKYNPQPKPQTVDNGTVPNAEESVDKTDLPSGTKVTWKTNPDVSTPGSHPTVALVTYPDGTVDEVEVPITVKKQSDTFTPTAKQPGQTAKHGSDPSAEGSINTNGLPSGTTYKWVEKPDTNTTPGSKPGKVLITYPDNSTEEVTVTVEVTPQKDDYNPQPKPQTVDNGTVPNAEDSVDKTGLPSGTTIAWKETPVVNTPGSHPTVALVTYPDGTVDEVEVPITVKKQSDTFTPTAKQPNQTAKHGSDPSAQGSINTENLPKGTTYKWVEKPDTNTTPGSKPGKVLITYPDNSTEEVTVTVEVTPQKDDYNPQPKPQTVDNGTVPNAEDSVDKTGLPEGTTIAWKETPVVNTPGSHPTVALVTYPDGTVDEVEVPITVKEQKDTYNPTAKQPGQTAKHGIDPSAEGSINTEGLPKGTTYKWVEKPDTNTTPGSKPGKVLITYPDNSTEEVTVTVEVTPQKDDYNPQPKPQTVDNGTVPNAEDSVDKTGLPSGTTIAWKETPVVNTPGSHPTVALVTYPDGTVDEVEVPITVKKQSDTFTPTAKQPGQTAKHGSDSSAEGSINTNGLPSGTTYKWVEKPDTNTTPGNKPGKVLITYPDNSTEEVTVTVEVTPQKDDYNPQPKPQTVDNGTVPNAEDSVDKTDLPSGTKVTWKTNPDVSTPGSHPTVALVTYPDGTVDEVEVPITVKEQKDTYNPTAKQPGQTAKHGIDPSAEGSINTEGLPKGTTYKWVEKPDTNTTPGSKPGKVLITYPDNSTEEVTVTVEVTPQKNDYNPQPKPQTVDNGTVPNAEDSVDKTGLPSGTTIAWKETPVVNTPGSHPTVALVTYPDGTVDEVEVPITVKEQKDTYNPTAKQPGQTAKHGSDPSAEGSINTNGLPSGTTYKWVEKPDTNTTPGNKPGKVLITYPDNSTEEVTVTVEVTPQKDDYNPQPKPQTVDNGTVPNAEESVDKTDLPSGTKVTWKTNPDVSTPGSHPTVALVTYPDGTVDEVEVPITVKKQSDTFTPTAKQPGQTAKHGSDPSAEGSINTNGLPSGTTYKWVEKPDTNTTPGSKPGKVLITYPDNSTEEVTVTVEVTPQKDDYNPQPKPQTVDNGTVPNAEDSVDKTGLPSGTTIAWKETPVVNTPGSHPTVALVTYPDGTVDEVEVPITVKKQSDTFTPTAKQPGQTAKHGSDPSAEGSINTNGLPSGTTYKWVEKPDTNTTPGNKPGKVLITYPDNSTEEVTVTVEVTPQKDDYNPQPKAQTITNGDIPNVNDSIENVRELPEGTRIEWKDGIIPNTDTPGTISAKITITYPDNTTDEVDVKIIVNIQTAKGEPEEHPTLPEFSGGVNGDPEVQPALPEFSGGVNGDPEEHPALPEFSGGVNGEPEEHPALPEFSGGVNGEPEEHPALPEFSGGVNGEPEVQPDSPEFSGGVNGDPEIQPDLPEFSGGVNGDSEIQPELPKYVGRVNNESEIRSNFRENTSNIATKRLANTGQSQNNSELAGLGLAIVGLFAAIKRRKNEEE